ncbi:hypothetical protein D3C76_1715200 [compost metagenome]
MLIHLQRPPLTIPIPQHNALGRLIANLQLVDGRAMGMPVDQGFHTISLHDPWHFVRRDIDNVIGLHPRLRTAFTAQFARQFMPGA